ncbi:MAG: DUF368 domain-containing protein [Lachnospiraceae bacterium]|nr:DUF368 domain-containing protein [Lachnospiraceae bacterium]
MTDNKANENNIVNDTKRFNPFEWLFRLLKGIVVGIGFIVPGISGAALAAIFGFYEELLSFVGNLTKDFTKNLRFFLPIGIGGFAGVILGSRVMGDFFKIAEIPLIWFFVGCVCGIMPGLFAKAGQNGRRKVHLAIAVVSFILMGALMLALQGGLETVNVPTEQMWVWFFVGALMALSAVIPGFSTGTLLIYLGIYGEVMDGIGNLVLPILIPVMIGAVVCAFLVAKVFDRLFKKYHAGMYHFVIGLILASTVIIIPWNGKILENGDIASYDLSMVLLSIVSALLGAALGAFMWIMEKNFTKTTRKES